MEEIRETVVELIGNLKAKAPSMPGLKPLSELELEKSKMEIRQNRFSEAKKKNIDPEIWCQVEPFFNENTGLYIFGTVGTGKTYLCHAINREWKLRGLPGTTGLVQINDLFTKIKATFNSDHKGKTEEKIIEEMSGYKTFYNNAIEILLLDDVGTERPSEWANQTLFSIIDARYRESRPTVFTSNYSLDDLVERIGDRIPSRIAEMCKIIKLEGSDRRIKK